MVNYLKKHWLKIVGVVALIILGLIGWEYLASGVVALLAFLGLKLNKHVNSSTITIANPKKEQDEKDANTIADAHDVLRD